jgi:hypothetical protein
MDHLPESPGTISPKILTKDHEDQLGGQMAEHQRLEGSQHDQLHHYNNAVPTSMDRPCHLHVQYTSPQADPVLPAEGRSSSHWWAKETLQGKDQGHITSSNWEHIALDRSSWKKSVQKGAAHHKEKDKKAQPPAIGLYSHLKTHK